MKTKKYKCPKCGLKSKNSIFRESTRQYKGDGYNFELDVETPYCERCGSPIYDKEIEQGIREIAHNIIKKQINAACGTTGYATDEDSSRVQNESNVTQNVRTKENEHMTIGDLIKNKDYDCISYRLLLPNGENIFAGEFASKNGEIISLDGDTYSKDEKVLRYEEWDNPKKHIKNGLTVVVECDEDEIYK